MFSIIKKITLITLIGTVCPAHANPFIRTATRTALPALRMLYRAASTNSNESINQKTKQWADTHQINGKTVGRLSCEQLKYEMYKLHKKQRNIETLAGAVLISLTMLGIGTAAGTVLMELI